MFYPGFTAFDELPGRSAFEGGGSGSGFSLGSMVDARVPATTSTAHAMVAKALRAGPSTSSARKKRRKKKKADDDDLDFEPSDPYADSFDYSASGGYVSYKARSRGRSSGGAASRSSKRSDRRTGSAASKASDAPTTSFFRGVSCCGKDRKWQARIRDSNKVKYLGRYASQIDAAFAYDAAARARKGDRAPTNFVPGVDAADRARLKTAFDATLRIPESLMRLVSPLSKHYTSAAAAAAGVPNTRGGDASMRAGVSSSDVVDKVESSSFSTLEMEQGRHDVVSTPNQPELVVQTETQTQTQTETQTETPTKTQTETPIASSGAPKNQ